jgi:hypothetical protein
MLTFIIKFFNYIFGKTKYKSKISSLEKDLSILKCLLDYELIKNKYEELFKIIALKSPLMINLIRCGSMNDGGYVIADNLDSTNQVLSFGVGSNFDFESDLAKKGKVIYMFDGTLKNTPKNTLNVNFINKNVYGSSFIESEKLKPNRNDNYLHINDIFSKNLIRDAAGKLVALNLDSDILLKMDIEGAEYDAITSLEKFYFDSFSQIVIEFHDIYRNLFQGENKLIKSIAILNKTHELISIHGNNFGAYLTFNGNDYPDVIETTWLRKDLANFENSENHFNSKLAAPNNPGAREIVFHWSI